MAKLWRAESAENDPKVGGFVVEFPSGARKVVAWRSGAPIPDVRAAAKQYATALVQHMLDHELRDDLNRTNIPSLVAAIQRILMDWNEELRRALYAANETHATLVQ
jgi:hypothetical protein